MGLNDIRLTASALVELYGHSLVDTGDVPAGLQQSTGIAAQEPVAPGGAPATGRKREAVETAPPSTASAAAAMAPPATEPEASGGKAAPVPTEAKAPVKKAALIATEPEASGGKDAPVPTEAKAPVKKVAPPASEPEALAKKAATPASPWRSLGNNRRHILIVVDYEGTAYLPDDELTFLTKMLDACKLSLDDVAIVNRAHYRTATSSDYLKHFGSCIVFLFGPDPASFGLPLSFPAFQVQAFAGTTFLHTPPLEERMRDDLFKSKLWVSLKRIFNL